MKTSLVNRHLLNRGARIGRVGSLLDVAARALRDAYGFVGSDIMDADDVKAIAQANDTVAGLAQRLDEVQLREASGAAQSRQGRKKEAAAESALATERRTVEELRAALGEACDVIISVTEPAHPAVAVSDRLRTLAGPR